MLALFVKEPLKPSKSPAFHGRSQLDDGIQRDGPHLIEVTPPLGPAHVGTRLPSARNGLSKAFKGFKATDLPRLAHEIGVEHTEDGLSEEVSRL